MWFDPNNPNTSQAPAGTDQQLNRQQMMARALMSNQPAASNKSGVAAGAINGLVARYLMRKQPQQPSQPAMPTSAIASQLPTTPMA